MDSVNYEKFPEGTKEKLDLLRAKIDKELSDYENYNGISFNSYGDTIIIQTSSKQIKGYYFGDHFEFKKDLSNYDEAFGTVVENWKAADTPENIKFMKNFIAEGEKYGWD